MAFWDYLGSGPVAALVYLAFAFKLLGFTARDELKWRGLMLTASLLYLAYYYLVAEPPLWDAIVTNGLLAAVNLGMIAIVLAERSAVFLSTAQRLIYPHFDRLTPGQFRSLMRLANLQQAMADTRLTTEGAPVAHLHFVQEGQTIIRKGDHVVTLSRTGFVGELAFLTGAPATATVTLAPGARFLTWQTEDLKRLITRRPALANALMAQLNIDLAIKVATSHPIAQEPATDPCGAPATPV
ncbi:cyclic nucleotide-binding domain-containing protein [Roseicyclus amphidinii]|uniref:cyclic nucleotide-binding domain-containing protein n=1 Tax=Roseicyclus amphidinii TaxID=3034232 RepID=UPI0024E127BF|nr:cyclic nucleotide-binding domain-containing protein [Roseicyclus sp. Amp-Y-6]